MSREIIEEVIHSKLNSMEEISLETIICGEDLVKNAIEDEMVENHTTENNFKPDQIIKHHVESIVCSSKHLEVYFYINLL